MHYAFHDLFYQHSDFFGTFCESLGSIIKYYFGFIFIYKIFIT